MRCPKCGYNSFDHLDSCKKCGKDLSEHKQRFGIVSVLFPGQMKPVDKSAVEDESVVDDVVAAATGTAAAGIASAAAEDFSAAEPKVESSEGDDFGFDFMGDSEEEEDLSFDELFEEASADEDVEETLPSPEKEAAGANDFAFDLDDEEATAEGGLEDDFGFDPTDVASEAAESLDADDFELPPADKDDFSFDTDNVEFEDSEDEEKGTKEDPKAPFDLPESSRYEEASEESFSFVIEEPELDSSAAEVDDLLPPEPLTLSVQAATDESTASFADSFFIDDPQPEGEAAASSLELTSAAEELLPEDTVMGFPQQAKVHFEDQQRELDVEPAAEEPMDLAGLSSAPLAAPAVVDSVASAPALEEESSDAAGGPLPATGSRIAAFCCDLLLLVLVGFSFVVAAESAISPAGDRLLPSLETLIDLSIPYFLVLFSLAFGYFTLFHFLAGQTPGKMLAKLRVETVSGEPLLFSQAFLRSVGGLLQVLPAGLGYLAILSSPERRGWNDQLAGTRLVSLRGLPEEL